MAIPADHLTYLRQQDYTPRSPGDFSKEEAALLRQYGHWMEALASGWIAPTTPDQQHFLQVAHGEAAPQTPFEHVWRKHSDQRGDAPATDLAEPHAADAPAAADAMDDGTGPQFAQLAEVRRYADAMWARKEAERAAVLQTVQAQLEAIDRKYAQSLAEADQAVAELEIAVKAEVVKAGKSLRAGTVQAVYYRGSVTWDGKGLAEFVRTNPALEQFRRVGAPRVVIKYR